VAQLPVGKSLVAKTRERFPFFNDRKVSSGHP
jgi:hypothetical protein